MLRGLERADVKNFYENHVCHPGFSVTQEWRGLHEQKSPIENVAASRDVFGENILRL